MSHKALWEAFTSTGTIRDSTFPWKAGSYGEGNDERLLRQAPAGTIVRILRSFGLVGCDRKGRLLEFLNLKLGGVKTFPDSPRSCPSALGPRGRLVGASLISSRTGAATCRAGPRRVTYHLYVYTNILGSAEGRDLENGNYIYMI